MGDDFIVPGSGPDTGTPAGSRTTSGTTASSTTGATGTTTPGSTGQGGNQPPPPPQIPWEWAVANWKVLAALAAVALVAVVGVWILAEVGFPKLPALTPENATVERTNSAVGAFLVRAGVVLAVVAFIPFLVLSVLASFKIEKPAATRREESVLPGIFKDVLAAIPDLLKIPAGIGVVLVLLGTLLMSATVLGEDAASPTPGSATTPTPSPIVTPTASPR